MLVGNKVDHEHEREVSLDEVKTFVEKNHVDFSIETSAKSGEAIEALFLRTTQYMWNRFSDQISLTVSFHKLSLTPHSHLTLQMHAHHKKLDIISKRSLDAVGEVIEWGSYGFIAICRFIYLNS